MELWQFLGSLHPKLVQFPLVLLFVGLLFDAAGLLWKSPRARWAGLIVSGMGTVGLLFAFICGIYAEIWAGRAGIPQHPIELHELAANVAAWGFVILFAWRILLAENSKIENQQSKIKGLRVYVCIGLLWYSLLILTGYLGGQLVFEYGAGVTAAQSAGTLSLSDLNTLATRQTDENLRYSEWMHHVFGFLTLGLAASLLVQAIRPAEARRLKWIVPAFLLAGGIFLFFKADLDLYAFTDVRQWRDREVQLHKVIAIVMGTIGLIGMWRLRKPSAPTAPAENATNDSNSKLVAVMALIGGAMFFTHVHTVAPYANVAAGVYIAHAIMGLVALAIGAARLAQEYLPRFRKQLSLAFAMFLLIEAGLLINYNEGLPWFIGYGRYDRWGYGDENQRRLYTVAPFGNFRAIMNVSEKDGKAFVGFHTSLPPPSPDEYTIVDDAVTLALDEPPHLLITHGTSEIDLTLTKSRFQDKVSESTFEAQADFLKTTPFVSARLLVTVHGKRMVGYFDPWVTERIIPVPPNEIAKFECPMHEGVHAMKAGKCPLCQMDLVEIKPPRPAGELHNTGYDLKTTLEPGEKFTQKPMSSRIVMQLFDAGGKGVPLAIMHEQPMHLIIVSQDLSYFDHIHPMQLVGAEGSAVSFFLDYAFPRAGSYILYADVTPVGDRQQIFRIPLTVDAQGARVPHDVELSSIPLRLDEGSKLITPIRAPRTPNDSAAFDLNGPPPLEPIPGIPAIGPGVIAAPSQALVEFTFQPRTLYAGLHSELRFRLSDAQGRPITDLSPYVGAMGHCMIISQDTGTFLHSHPEDIMGITADWRGGPEIALGTTFPKAGRYRIWAQFKRGEQLIVAPFTVEVKSPPVPAGLLRFLLNE